MQICPVFAGPVTYYLINVYYMLEIPSIIRIIEEIDLLKLSELEPQGYKVRDSFFHGRFFKIQSYTVKLYIHLYLLAIIY